MGNQYKLTLSNQALYREVDLTDDMDSVTIGTAAGCDVRLRKELFFDTFELQLTRRGDKWEIICSDGPGAVARRPYAAAVPQHGQ